MVKQDRKYNLAYLSIMGTIGGLVTGTILGSYLDISNVKRDSCSIYEQHIASLAELAKLRTQTLIVYAADGDYDGTRLELADIANLNDHMKNVRKHTCMISIKPEVVKGLDRLITATDKILKGGK
ncbi:MAG TPA: hypothetical protein VJI68_02765 [Candidatus Nanoarchaeia archaeon]|nr:hypothetical protein [Candidatus Nanoarchaeia archaeon]